MKTPKKSDSRQTPRDGAKVPQHKALAMRIKPAQGVAQARSGSAGKARGKASRA